jgi:hypothetical protein
MTSYAAVPSRLLRNLPRVHSEWQANGHDDQVGIGRTIADSAQAETMDL